MIILRPPGFTDLAPRGDQTAQNYLGYMYANGKVCPKILSCRRDGIAAPANVSPRAQYQLGLLYDKPKACRQDYVTAYALLNLAVAGAAGPEREIEPRAENRGATNGVRGRAGSALFANRHRRSSALSPL
jgi:hypothetical protein